jgi:hypothetical protein
MTNAATNYRALLALTGSVPVAYAPSGIWKVYEDRHDLDAARAMVHAAQDAGYTLTRAGRAILTGQTV